MSNQERAKTNVANTVQPIKPVGYVFNVTDQDITDFLTNYISNIKGITTLTGVRAVIRREGTRDPELKFVAFFPLRSKDILSNTDNIPEFIRDQMEYSNLRISDQLTEVLRPITNRNNFRIQRASKDLAAVELDVFRVLGLLFAANPSQHELIVTDVRRTKKEHFVATVIKKERFLSPGTGPSNDYLVGLAERL